MLCRVVNMKATAYYGVPAKRHKVIELVKFGANLRRERNSRNITQQRLAELVDLNVRTIQKIEAGETDILITTVFRLQRALGCSWDRLCKM